MHYFYILGTIVACIFGYLIGSVSWSIIIVRLFIKKDIREFGSKNAGATNASRILGKKVGFMIVVLDALKVITAGLIGLAISSIQFTDVAVTSANLHTITAGELHFDIYKTSVVVPGLAALIGHCYPIYHKFKGGKAVSCFWGLALLVNTILGLLFVMLWIIIIFISRRVSIASVGAALLVSLLSWTPWLWGMTSYAGFSDGSVWFAQTIDHGDGAFVWAFWSNFMHDLMPPMRYYEPVWVFDICITIAAIILTVKHHENIVRVFKGTESYFFTWNKEEREAKKVERKAALEVLKEEKRNFIGDTKKVKAKDNKIIDPVVEVKSNPTTTDENEKVA